MILPSLQNWKKNVPGSFQANYKNKGNKNKIQRKQKKKDRAKRMEVNAKELLKPLHLSKSRMMLQNLLVHYLFIMKE